MYAHARNYLSLIFYLLDTQRNVRSQNGGIFGWNLSRIVKFFFKLNCVWTWCYPIRHSQYEVTPNYSTIVNSIMYWLGCHNLIWKCCNSLKTYKSTSSEWHWKNISFKYLEDNVNNWNLDCQINVSSTFTLKHFIPKVSLGVKILHHHWLCDENYIDH